MSFKKYNVSDNGTAVLDEPIDDSTTSFIARDVQNMPTSNFTLTAVQKEAGEITSTCKIYVGTRSGNTFSNVIVGYAGDTGKDFNEGDELVLNIIAEHITDIQNELTRLNNDKANLSGATFTGNVNIENTNPRLVLKETDAPTNEKYWFFDLQGGDLRIRGANDDFSVGYDYFAIKRTGVNIDSFIFKQGNVGIGTSNPETKLDIKGTGDLLKVQADNGDERFLVKSNGEMLFTDNTRIIPNYGPLFKLASNTNGWQFQFENSSGARLLRLGGSGIIETGGYAGSADNFIINSAINGGFADLKVSNSSSGGLFGIWRNNNVNGKQVMRLGNNWIWVDSSGKLRISGSFPGSDGAGTIVGTQS